MRRSELFFLLNCLIEVNATFLQFDTDQNEIKESQSEDLSVKIIFVFLIGLFASIFNSLVIGTFSFVSDQSQHQSISFTSTTIPSVVSEEENLFIGEDQRCSCGMRNIDTDKIVGGSQATISEFPWQVGLIDDDQDDVSPRWVLIRDYEIFGCDSPRSPRSPNVCLSVCLSHLPQTLDL